MTNLFPSKADSRRSRFRPIDEKLTELGRRIEIIACDYHSKVKGKKGVGGVNIAAK